MIEPGTQTIWQAFAATAGLYQDRPVFNIMAETAGIYGIEPGEVSYRQVQEQVTELAAALQQKGYGPGFRVMLLLENRPQFFVWLLALNRIGASVVPVNPDLRHSELTYMAGHSEPSLIVGLANRCDELAAAASDAGLSVPVIAPGDPVPQPGTAGAVALRVDETGEALGSEEMEAALLYTSGTTGNPKGCILTNTYFLEAGRWYAEAGGLCALTSNGERMITPLPIFHMNAMAYSFMAMVAVGGCLTVLDRFHPVELVAQRARKRRDVPALPGRHAIDADGRARGTGRPGPFGPVRVRRGRGSKASCGFRGAFRLSTGRGLGHDGDRRGRGDLRQPAAAQGGRELPWQAGART
jgi:acyl-CoA synthetase (AMP-forming)/AMP-acid ligase II